MAYNNEGVDNNAHPTVPAPPGPLSYAQVVAAPEHSNEDEWIDGSDKAEPLGVTGPGDSRKGGVGAGKQAGGVEENAGKGGEKSLTIEEEDGEARGVNPKDPKPSVEVFEPSEIESEPASEVEAEPSEVESEPTETESWTNDAKNQSVEPSHDGDTAGATDGRGRSPDRKPRDKPVKKTRFAAETTDIISEVAAKDQRSEDVGISGSRGDEEGIRTAGGRGIDDGLVSREPGDSGCSTRRHSHYSTRPRRLSPMTREVQGGEQRAPQSCGLGSTAGYDIGDLPGSRSRPPCYEKESPHATRQEDPETPESQELGNIILESGEFGCNVGNLPSSHPGKHKGHRRAPRGGAQLPTRHTKGGDSAGATAECEELGKITLDKGEFGYNVGKGEGGKEKENPNAWETRRRSEQTTGADGTRETEELANIAIGEGDFGYNVGKGGSGGEKENPNATGGRRQSAKTASGKETKGTGEPANITMGEGEVGNNIGMGESGKWEENPMASDARNNSGREAGTEASRTGGSTRAGNDSNGTLQNYLHTFLPRGATPLSPPTTIHASEVIELTEQLPGGQQSQIATIAELRTVLADFKSDLLTSSITAESRLQKVESDVDFIRKQLSGGVIATTTTATHRAANGINGASPVPPGAGFRGRILMWGFIAMGFITATSLAALWGVTTNRITMREGVDFGDRIAEWLFMQGRKG